MNSATSLYTFVRQNGAIAIKKYVSVSLSQMSVFIFEHLISNCSTQPTYNLSLQLESGQQVQLKEAEEIMRHFKKSRVTNFTSTVAWEYFQEMSEDAPMGSRERAVVIQNHFHSFNLPE